MHVEGLAGGSGAGDGGGGRVNTGLRTPKFPRVPGTVMVKAKVFNPKVDFSL